MSAPDLTGYRTVHLALRGGADLLASVAADIPASHRARVAAFRRYWTGYAREVLTHHRTEDDIMFPALVSRVPVKVIMNPEAGLLGAAVHAEALLT